MRAGTFNFDAALELLYRNAGLLPGGDQGSGGGVWESPDEAEACAEGRADEAEALEAIFDDLFVSTEAGFVITSELSPDRNTRVVPPPDPGRVRKAQTPCPFFVAGTCRFGAECHFRHGDKLNAPAKEKGQHPRYECRRFYHHHTLTQPSPPLPHAPAFPPPRQGQPRHRPCPRCS